MKRTELYEELMGLADSMDDSVTPYLAAKGILSLFNEVVQLEVFEEDSGELQPGDRVCLTGESWKILPGYRHGNIVKISHRDKWGYLAFDAGGYLLYIYKDDVVDYSAEKVND